MNEDFENKLSALMPTGKTINRDSLFFELGKQQKKTNGLPRAFLAGAIAASFPWLFLTQTFQPKIETPSFSSPISMEMIEPVKSEPYSLLAYRKVLIETNDLPNQILTKNENPIESLQDLQKEFSLYQP